MNSPRFLLVMLALFWATTAKAQTDAWRELDDFSNYPLGEVIAGKGERGAWRSRGVNLANSGEVVAADGVHVLGLKTRGVAIFDSPDLFSLPADTGGRVSFRMRLPSEGAKHDDALFFILKSRAQADEDLTRPYNGLLLLQVAFDAAEQSYRLKLEGPGSSPTPAMIAPGAWYQVEVRVNMALASYEVWLTPPGGATKLVTNHLYRDGVVPFKNRGVGPAELLYLRNHSLPGVVEIDTLRFMPGQ